MSITQRLIRRFADFDYRHAYVDSFVDASVATQIKVLREQRQLTQTALAERAGMKQSQISDLEDVNHTSWKIRTLKKIAKALDLVLVVRFESFGKVLPDIEDMSRAALERHSPDTDPVFAIATAGIATAQVDLASMSIPKPLVGQGGITYTIVYESSPVSAQIAPSVPNVPSALRKAA